MRFTFATVAALVAPIIADTITPAPTTTSDSWFDGVPPWATSDPAKWSSIYNSLLSEGKIPSTLTAVPWPTGSYGPGQGPWGPGHGPGGGAGHWGGPSGPFSEWSTRSDWRSGPWTAWWDGSKCPASDWPGWTAGPWSTAPPWTSWKGCTASTTATSVITTTVSGVVATSTTYGLQVAAAAAEEGSGSASGSAAPEATGKKGAAGRVDVGLGVVVGAAVLGVAVAL